MLYRFSRHIEHCVVLWQLAGDVLCSTVQGAIGSCDLICELLFRSPRNLAVCALGRGSECIADIFQRCGCLLCSRNRKSKGEKSAPLCLAMPGIAHIPLYENVIQRTQEWHPVKDVRNACKVRCKSIHIGVHDAAVQEARDYIVHTCTSRIS